MRPEGRTKYNDDIVTWYTLSINPCNKSLTTECKEIPEDGFFVFFHFNFRTLNVTEK